MKKPLFVLILGGLNLLTANASSGGTEWVQSPLISDILSLSPKRAECGGTIRTDGHHLSFPGIPGDSLVPGQTCLWTIHLESKRDFWFNFTQFDVNSDDSSCSTAGVRLYSLSNLVPPGKFQQEVFCSGHPPRSSGFYLGGTVVALVVYSTVGNSHAGSGFTLTWSGVSFDPLHKKHVSSFSSAESGVVGYPVVGTYEPNLVATWAVRKEEGRKSDVIIENLRLEECPNSDPCTCDALLLYKVEARGVLSEKDRFCTNLSAAVTRVGVPDHFLLAFYTDSHESTGGNGFSAKYFPTGVETTTDPPTTQPPIEPTTQQQMEPTTQQPMEPTTQQQLEPTTQPPIEPTTQQQLEPTTQPPIEPTTQQQLEPTTQPPTPQTTTQPTTELTTEPAEESPPPERETTPCGGVFTEPTGYIAYHLNSNYANGERCVWTLQHPQATSYKFHLTDYFVSDPNDGLVISTLYSYSSNTNNNAFITNYRPVGTPLTRPGDVAILTFFSDAAKTSRGFKIHFEAVRSVASYPKTGVIANTTSLHVDYPLSGYYCQNRELATFIFSPNFKFDLSGYLTNFAEYKTKLLESPCNDWLNVFIFVSSGLSDTKWVPHPNNSRICADATTAKFSHDDMLLFVFKSNYIYTYSGFELNFFTRRNDAITTELSF